MYHALIYNTNKWFPFEIGDKTSFIIISSIEIAHLIYCHYLFSMKLLVVGSSQLHFVFNKQLWMLPYIDSGGHLVTLLQQVMERKLTLDAVTNSHGQNCDK